MAAFNEGGIWLDALKQYLWENRRYAESFIEAEIPLIHAVKGEATYLLWLDCQKAAKDIPELSEFIRRETGLYLSDGTEYRNGTGFLRMNLACQRSTLKEGLQRLKEGIAACLKKAKTF